MKEGRIEGRVEGGQYVIRGATGVIKQMTLDEARRDTKLAGAIRRNGWEGVPDGS